MASDPNAVPDLVDAAVLERVLGAALARGGDYADVFCEDRTSTGLSLDDRRVERASGGHDRGVGVRVVSGAQTYFGHVDSWDEATLLALAAEVAAGVSRGDARTVTLSRPRGGTVIADRVLADPAGVAATEKAALLHRADEGARTGRGDVVQVAAGYAESRQRVQIATSEGVHTGDDRTRVRLSVQVVARRGDRMQTGFRSVGRPAGFEVVGGDAVDRVAAGAADTAVTMLDAEPCPSGAMTVVLNHGFGGVLFHEACGHGLEADAVQKRASVYHGRLGERVAAAHVSAHDDGRLPGGWGSNRVDDEGVPTQDTLVIEDGVLRSYLYDGTRARRDGAAPTGNGRRQSFRHLPIPRMTTTFIAPTTEGTTSEEVIASVERGIFCASFAGGQVEPAKGDFVFGVSEAYLIEHGELTTPLRGATLIGSGIDVLNRVELIGADFESAVGFCGKDGQSVPAGVAQSTVRVREMTVGGTAV